MTHSPGSADKAKVKRSMKQAMKNRRKHRERLRKLKPTAGKKK